MSDGRNHAIFEVGGKVYNLRVSYNALAEYQKIASMSDLKDRALPAYRALIWAGINAYGSQSVTLDQVGDLCEQFIEEKGFVAFVKEADKILKSGIWLKAVIGGNDMGNVEPVAKSTKLSKNLSKITED